MALMLGAEALEGVVATGEAIDIIEVLSKHEAAGKTFVAPGLNSTFEGGWMQVLFAADYEAGYAATKVFHMTQGVGVRYVVSLYRIADGELLAILDGRLITDLRTGAASGVVARKVKIETPVTMGVIGTGDQARMQLETLAGVYQLESVRVFSPTSEHRERFARQMSSKLALPVKAADSAEAAARGASIVVVATSNQGSEPVLRGEWLDRCRLLCAVGGTRLQSVEVDERAFADAKLIVVDTPRVAEEPGDVMRALAKGAFTAERQVTLAQVVTGASALPDKGLVVFKSIGTALQDLALAVRYYQRLRLRQNLPSALDLASLKKPLSAAARGAKSVAAQKAKE